LFPDEPANLYQRAKASIEKMKELDVANLAAYNDAIDSKILSGSKYFWQSDFHVHRRKEFYFSVRMSSERVIGTEAVNEENIKGYYQGDGVSLLNSNGDEYFNIPPFLDWKKLPGTTIIQDTAALPVIKAWDFKTNSVFVGGVDNGENGVAAMAYDRDGLSANKSWFMFNDKIVCLGSGINANTKFPVTTTINQVFLRRDVVINQDNKIMGSGERNQTLNPDWIVHDSTGYFFPLGGSVKMESRFLEGTWNRVVKRIRPVILTESILRLWFDHGSNPEDENYAYILVPNATNQKMEDLQKSSPFKIVNTKVQQSVETVSGDKAGIIFYAAGNAAIFGGIAVDKPCIILLEKTNNLTKISVSDPSHKLQNISISLEGKYTGEYTTNSNNMTTLNLALPQGENSGSTMTVVLEKK
jgi:chondroitin AC lyase